jgi:hypothetical protein
MERKSQRISKDRIRDEIFGFQRGSEIAFHIVILSIAAILAVILLLIGNPNFLLRIIAGIFAGASLGTIILHGIRFRGIIPENCIKSFTEYIGGGRRQKRIADYLGEVDKSARRLSSTSVLNVIYFLSMLVFFSSTTFVIIGGGIILLTDPRYTSGSYLVDNVYYLLFVLNAIILIMSNYRLK